MKISQYMPELYNNFIEMNTIIYSEENEFENHLKIDLQNSFKDNFAKIATEKGIEKFEKLLGIQLDENKNNLEYRRARVITKLNATSPLTYKWLENNLINLVGRNNFYIELDNNNYKLTLSISNVYINTALTLFDVYRPLIPANLILIINLFDENPANLYASTILQSGETTIYESEVL